MSLPFNVAEILALNMDICIQEKKAEMHTYTNDRRGNYKAELKYNLHGEFEVESSIWNGSVFTNRTVVYRGMDIEEAVAAYLKI